MTKSVLPCLGLDIGTTTISAIVVDIESGNIIFSKTEAHEAAISASNTWEKTQDPAKIEETALRLVQTVKAIFPDLCSIGITGAMHGILYRDSNGKALSPLYTWQDLRAAEGGEQSTCQVLYERTGCRVPAGYGLATHASLLKNDDVPVQADHLCTIADHIVGCLTQNKPILHTTQAASLGFFDMKERNISNVWMNQAQLDPSLLPEVVDQCVSAGTYESIPVSVSIGDNQAAFLGTIKDPASSVLVNIGTGSQISFVRENDAGLDKISSGSIEARPYFEGHHLLSGCALCGGRAYALLERFFRLYAEKAGMGEASQYAVLGALAEEGLLLEDLPVVLPLFAGTREDPAQRAQIREINENNFTPAAFAAGLLRGMAEELHTLLKRMPGNETARVLTASGNAVRKNKALRKALARVFDMPVHIPVHNEEAAVGAAIFGAAAAGLSDMNTLRSRIIRYEE